MKPRKKEKASKAEEQKEEETWSGLSEWSDARLPYQPLWSKIGSDVGSAPTAAQLRAWPAALSGKDVLAISATGSGKTFAYLLPAACCAREKSGQSLVLAPTRELARQIWTAAKEVAKAMDGDFKAALVAPGSDSKKDSKEEQQSALIKPETFLIVATPGRLLDCLGARSDNDDDNKKDSHDDIYGRRLKKRLRCIVLDEADKMLALGFKAQLDDIFKRLPSVQTLLFSATFPERLKDTLLAYTKADNLVTLLLEEVSHKRIEIPEHIEQRVHVCALHKRPRLLLRFLERVFSNDAKEKRRQASMVLVFGNTSNSVREVRDLVGRHFPAKVAAVWGALPQKERDARLTSFRAGKVPILVATDLVARGIHLKNLRFVVNWDGPPDLDIYAHRVGRVGRDLKEADRKEAIERMQTKQKGVMAVEDEFASKAVALTFFTRDLRRFAPPLIQILKQTHQTVSPDLLDLIKKKKKRSRDDNEEEEAAAETKNTSTKKKKGKQKKHGNNNDPPLEPTEDIDPDVLAALRAIA